MGGSDFLRSFPPRFVAFAWRYLVRVLSFVSPAGLPRVRSLPARAGSLLPESSLPPFLDEESAGSPRFLRNLRTRASLFDPGGALAPGRFGASVLPSATTTASASTGIRLSGLNLAARVLPVYASQPGLPPFHARLGSGR
jgi:hypothetical protein